ncbi:MAG: hypothetical protein AAGU78_18930 [Chloroflexota bacterium]|jgi:hypothetical protein|nr:hypothetical protein [Anaerolineae bacterium]HMM29467.1 hypothetical protein [Aggregatilineaceae bacterium]
MFSTNHDPRRESARQGEEFIALVHQKMSRLVQEFASGEINRTQFHRLYDRYQRQIAAVAQLLAESDPALWRTAVADGEDTQHLKKRLSAKPIGMAVFLTGADQPLQTFGAFEIAPGRIRPMLEGYRLAAGEVFRAGMRRTELDDGRWLCFVPGTRTTLVALFSLEPSDSQLATLDRLHQDFEQANRHALDQREPDPQALAYPYYTFVQRRGEALDQG